jgi:hypothetical protein
VRHLSVPGEQAHSIHTKNTIMRGSSSSTRVRTLSNPYGAVRDAAVSHRPAITWNRRVQRPSVARGCGTTSRSTEFCIVACGRPLAETQGGRDERVAPATTLPTCHLSRGACEQGIAEPRSWCGTAHIYVVTHAGPRVSSHRHLNKVSKGNDPIKYGNIRFRLGDGNVAQPWLFLKLAVVRSSASCRA